MAHGGPILLSRIIVNAANQLRVCPKKNQNKNTEYIEIKYFPVAPHRVTQHAHDTSPCQSDVGGLYVRARVSVSVSPGGNRSSLWRPKRGIRTHFGPSSPAPRSLDAGLSVATCTGSYSTHTGGMITSGCPGSSPRTPKKEEEEQRQRGQEQRFQ